MKDIEELTDTELYELLRDSINKAALYQSVLQRRHLNRTSKIDSKTKEPIKGVPTTEVCYGLSVIADMYTDKKRKGELIK